MRTKTRSALLVATAFLPTPVTAGGLAEATCETAPLNQGVDWSGAYAGGFLGGGSHAGTTQDNGGEPLDADGQLIRLDEFAGEAGLTLGYNFQRGSLVYGAEVDYAAISFDVAETYDDDYRQEAETESLFSIRGRVGVAIDQTLIYGTVGYGVASVYACASDDEDTCEPNDDDIVEFEDILGGLVFGLGH